MDFQLNKIQLMTRNSIREFVRKEIAPLAQEFDERAEFPWTIYKKAAELGVMDMTLPLEPGGSDTDFLSFTIAITEFAAGSAALANSIALTELIIHILHVYGSRKHHEQYFTRFVEAEILGAVALNESVGREVSAWPVQAVPDGNDYIISGSVEYIPNAPLADMAIVFARTGDEAVSAFLMEKNMSGFSAGESENLMGQRSLPIGELVMNDVRVPARNLLGQEGDGTGMITDCQSRIRVVDAAIALGIARAALEESVRYSNQRVQFGQTLSHFGAIKNKIADMAAGVEAARLLVYQAAVLMDQGKKSEKQSSIAKVFASDLAVEACKEAVQIHGGYGYIKEYPVERLYRDALFSQVHKETNEIQRRDIARLVYNEYK